MALRTHFSFETFGRAGIFGGSNAQWLLNAPPCLIHFLRIETSVAVSAAMPEDVGGRRIASSAVTREMIKDFSGLPGTRACRPGPRSSVAPSNVVKRMLPVVFRISASIPWHGQQDLDRIGRTSRLKSTLSGSSRGRSERAAARPLRAKPKERPLNPHR